MQDFSLLVRSFFSDAELRLLAYSGDVLAFAEDELRYCHGYLVVPGSGSFDLKNVLDAFKRDSKIRVDIPGKIVHFFNSWTGEEYHLECQSIEESSQNFEIILQGKIAQLIDHLQVQNRTQAVLQERFQDMKHYLDKKLETSRRKQAFFTKELSGHADEEKAKIHLLEELSRVLEDFETVITPNSSPTSRPANVYMQ